MNANELKGFSLDAAVAEAEGLDWDTNLTLGGRVVLVAGVTRNYEPSKEWWYGGPIIERERIDIVYWGKKTREPWCAGVDLCGDMSRLESDIAIRGATPLIAAMRAFVASKQT